MEQQIGKDTVYLTAAEAEERLPTGETYREACQILGLTVRPANEFYAMRYPHLRKYWPQG